MEPDVIPADKELRKKAIILVVAVVVVCALLMYLINAYMDSLNALFCTDPKLARVKARTLIIWSLRTVGLSVAILGAYYIQRGVKIIRIDRYPWPGMKVIRDTRVVRGRLAKVLGFLIIVLSSTLLVCGTLLAWYYPYKIMEKTGNCRLYN